jgi:hypothetical protein
MKPQRLETGHAQKPLGRIFDVKCLGFTACTEADEDPQSAKREPKPEAPPPSLPAAQAPACLYLRRRQASRRLLWLDQRRMASSGVSMSDVSMDAVRPTGRHRRRAGFEHVAAWTKA